MKSKTITFQLFLFYLLLFSFPIFSQTTRTDLQEENLKGKVKTIITTYYKTIYKNGKIVRNGYPENEYSLNEATYNKDGNLLTFKETNLSRSSDYILYQYFYDKNGRKIKKQKSNNGKKFELASQYSYTQGKYIEKIYMGDLYCIDTYKYNTQGDPIEKKSIGAGQNKYDTNYRVTLKYDASRRLIVADLSNGHRITKYSYNKEGHLEKETLYEDGDLVESAQYKYISFDNHKNWTERITFLTDYDGVTQPFKIETRVLTYYD